MPPFFHIYCGMPLRRHRSYVVHIYMYLNFKNNRRQVKECTTGPLNVNCLTFYHGPFYSNVYCFFIQLLLIY